jgi:hypothetical protein
MNDFVAERELYMDTDSEEQIPIDDESGNLPPHQEPSSGSEDGGDEEDLRIERGRPETTNVGLSLFHHLCWQFQILHAVSPFGIAEVVLHKFSVVDKIGIICITMLMVMTVQCLKTSLEEAYFFVALILNMGHAQCDKLKENWSRDLMCHASFSSCVMQRRFFLILWFLLFKTTKMPLT